MRLQAPLAVPIERPEGLRLVKMTKFVGLEAAPWEGGEDEGVAWAGDQAVIRWRYGEDGQPESNARFVRWSDGSLMLFVGDEAFDVTEQDTTIDHTYLFLRHESLMQGMCQLKEKLVFRPAQVKRLSMATTPGKAEGPAQRKVKMTANLVDPIKEMESRSKRQEEMIRSSEHLKRRQQKKMRGYQGFRLETSYLEEDMDEDEEEDGQGEGGDRGLAALSAERARRSLKQQRRVDDEQEALAEQRILRAKREAPHEDATPVPKRRRRSPIDEEEEDAYAHEGREEEGEASDAEEADYDPTASQSRGGPRTANGRVHDAEGQAGQGKQEEEDEEEEEEEDDDELVGVRMRRRPVVVMSSDDDE
ncbi:unnamed protein product [Ostreobium quekettii]|uniref:Leo1-like protein-domain-containing protein n=1 Tax=Ostreobium quekettii TaxID=121088 RepID=A0A8S1J5M0_9CHLO|nr:unnamed protein product [Ostreobium quekettii]